MKAVIFDMDGVIIDSEWLVSDCWSVIGEKYGIPEVRETCRKCLGLNNEATSRTFRERYGEDFPYDTYKQEVSALFHMRAKTELKLKSGVKEILQWLKGQKCAVGLATSTREQVAVAQLQELTVLSYFDKVVCGDMLKKSKPEPDIYLMACERLGAVPEESYAIEDSYNGIRAAYRAGMKAVMVPDLADPTPEMEEKSSVILENLIEVKEWLEKNM